MGAMTEQAAKSAVAKNAVELSQAFRDAKGTKFKSLRTSEIVVQTNVAYIVKGLIAPGDMAMIFGSPGGGKTVLAPYLSHCVATGKPCFGRRVGQGAVLYIAAEAGRDTTERMAALTVALGEAPNLHILAQPINLYDPNSGDVAGLEVVIRKVQPVLIVLDTMAAAFPGLEENDSSSMTLAVHQMKALTRICGSAMLVIHHPPKMGDTPRGHGALNAALDVTMRIENTNGLRSVLLGKNRNGPTHGVNMQFRISVVGLGTDQDGDAIEKPVLEELRQNEIGDQKLNAAARTALRFLTDLVNERGSPMPERAGFPPHHFLGVKSSQWLEECHRRSLVLGDIEEVRRAFNKAGTSLRDAGRIGICDGWVWSTAR